MLSGNVGTGMVTGKFTQIVTDGVDADRDPDENPLVGLQITFTPSVELVRNPGTASFTQLKPITATTNSSGVLVGPDGAAGIRLVATDDTDIVPSGWTYTCSVTGGLSLSFSFILPQGTTVDLAALAPIPSNPGVTVPASVIRSITEAQLVPGANVSIERVGDTLVIASTGSTGGGGTGLPSGGTPNQVLRKNSSVEGDASWTTLSKSSVGLSSVDNTADADKPASTAVVSLLGQKAALSHTHTSAAVTDLVEAVQDIVGAMLAAGTNVSLNYDDAGTGALTINSTGGAGGGLDAEGVRDAIGVALVGLGNISVAVNDAADTITITTTATANATDAALRDRSTHTGSQAISTITNLQTTLDAKFVLPADPGSDKVLFWDESANAALWLTLGAGLSISGTTIVASAASYIYVIYYDAAQSAWRAQGDVPVPTTAPPGVLMRFALLRTTDPATADARETSKPTAWANVDEIVMRPV